MLSGSRRLVVATRRSLSTSAVRRVTVLRGDGMGPECTLAAMQCLAAVRAPVEFDEFASVYKKGSKTGALCPDLLESARRNKFVLKGPLVTPADSLSPDVLLGRELGLFAHVVPVQSYEGVKTRHDGVRLTVIRENVQGEYLGLEHKVGDDTVLHVRVISREACTRLAEYAFEYALEHGRKLVTAVHKANIMKKADGLFLQCCREVAERYTGRVAFKDIIIDNCCMQLVSKPEQFDVLVMPNLYGNLVSEAAAGLVGGAGLVPGFNVSPAGIRVYEQGPRHAGADIAGQNKANPAGVLLSSVLMLQDMGLADHAQRLDRAVRATLAAGDMSLLTPDVGGSGTTSGFVQAVIDRLPAAASK